MHAKLVHAVNDEAPDDADGDRQKRDGYADGDVPEDNLGARVPNKMKYGGNVLERAQAISPRASTLT